MELGIDERTREMPKGLTFGQKVRRRRLELKLSQEKLANRLGLDRGTIIQYEKDRSVPRTTGAKQKLAEALELTTDELYDNIVGAVAAASEEAVSIGLNFGQLRRSFKKSGGQQLREWKRVFKFLLNAAALTEEDRAAIRACVEEIVEVQKARKKVNRR